MIAMSVLGVLEITGSLMFGYFLDRVNKLVMMTILYGIRIMGFAFLFMHGGGILGALIGGVSFDYINNYQILIGVDIFICMLVTLGYFFLYATRKRSFRLKNMKASA